MDENKGSEMRDSYQKSRLRHSYSNEFKKNAVLMLVQCGRPVHEVAQELGVELSVLYKWKKKFASDCLAPDTLPEHGQVSSADINLLRKEISDLKESMVLIRSVLQKTLTNICEF